MEDTRIAVLSIIVEDSESTAKLNEMIHDTQSMLQAEWVFLTEKKILALSAW